VYFKFVISPNQSLFQPVSLSSGISVVSKESNFIKCDIKYFYKNVSEDSKIALKLIKKIRNLARKPKFIFLTDIVSKYLLAQKQWK